MPYLERYYLGQLGPVRLYIHRFVASDPAGLHDHPFRRALSIILAGWYFEDRGAQRVRRRWFNLLGPDDFHRVVLPDNGRDVWTLFMHAPRTKAWGFLRPARQGPHGPEFLYEPQSGPDDPAFSTWYKTAPTGAELRRRRMIPTGCSAAFFKKKNS